MKHDSPDAVAPIKVSTGSGNTATKVVAPSETKGHTLHGGVLIPVAETDKVGKAHGADAAEIGSGVGLSSGVKKLRRTPNWVSWNGRPTVSLFSAICLIRNITPGRKYLAE